METEPAHGTWESEETVPTRLEGMETAPTLPLRWALGRSDPT